jgi:hypothetical protein
LDRPTSNPRDSQFTEKLICEFDKGEGEDRSQEIQYILNPMSAQVKLTLDTNVHEFDENVDPTKLPAKIQPSIEMDALKIILSKSQLDKLRL